MIQFHAERISPDLIEEVLPLADIHFTEVDPFPELEANYTPNFYLLNNEHFRVYTARERERLVGYAFFVVQKHPHYDNSLQAQQDLLFLLPEARWGLTGLSFMKFCDEELKKEGVQVIYHYSSHHRDIGPLLQRIGYEPIQTIYGKKVA